MTDRSDRVVGAVFLAALACLIAFFFDFWGLFGLAACGLLVLGLALGYGGARNSLAIRLSLAALFAAYALLLAGLIWVDRAGGGPRLVMGFPLGTALLVYGIWPLPLVAGLLYALLFRSSVLPEEKLQKFLAEHGRREPDR